MSESPDTDRVYKGRVAVSYGCITIHAGDGSHVDYQPQSQQGMLSAQINQIAFACALDPDLASLTIEVLAQEPPFEPTSKWDAAAEMVYEFQEPARITLAFFAAPPEERGSLDDFELPAGVYGVRTYARIDPHSREFVDEFGITETLDSTQLLVQFWSSRAQITGVKELKHDAQFNFTPV